MEEELVRKGVELVLELLPELFVTVLLEAVLEGRRLELVGRVEVREPGGEEDRSAPTNEVDKI